MNIKLTNNVGFCWGVRRALDLAIKSSSSSRKIYTYGPLIHNKDVVQMLKTKGIEPLPSDKMKSSRKNALVIRAHGIPPLVRAKLTLKGFKIIDATCPHVKKSQKMVQQYADKGYQIIIVGDKKHAEVISLVGYARNSRYHYHTIVISSPPEVVKFINSKPRLLKKKICILAQSTFQPQLYEDIVDTLRLTLSKDNELIILNTICHAPARRQLEVKELAKQVDAFVVVGDHKSANTTNLALLVRSLKIPAFQVASVSELPLRTLKKYHSIGITTGTSTPDSVLQTVIDKIIQL
ncbi:MAG: 4-hydroxy-3-methylbut-2-enyl diphosphate reductase [Planctomycetota bacterium]